LREVLVQTGVPPGPHTCIVSNWLRFDDASGALVGFSEPLIHMYNKDESHVRDLPFARDAVGRRAVLLLGDSLGDADMAGALPHDAVLRVGFLSHAQPDALVPAYADAFDIVLLDDAPADVPLAVLRAALGLKVDGDAVAGLPRDVRDALLV
jgi:5'-nucleotidase